MPTYQCTAFKGRLSPAQKSEIAREITRIHHEVTGAPGFFAQVIFSDVAPGDYFMGGTPVTHDQIFIYGHIRAGRSGPDKARLIRELAEMASAVAKVPMTGVWVYIAELPPAQMIEFGHVLPEPGDEPKWTTNLPAADRRFMERIGA